jgi:predicted phage tail protein
MDTRQLVIGAHVLFSLLWFALAGSALLAGNFFSMFTNVAVGCAIIVIGVVISRRVA